LKQKVLVIGPAEFKSGFSLVGVDYITPSEPNEIKKIIKKLYEEKNYGLVIIEDDYEKFFDHRTKLIIYESTNPLFFLLSFDPKHKVPVEEQISEIIRMSLGVQMKIKS
jgi:vacuolar-type H+-ATPase subunit F/Vma7